MHAIKKTGKLGPLGLLALTVIASPLAMADEPGWYGGIGAGQSRANIDDGRITDGLLNQGFSTDSISDTNRDTGYKLFAGYQFNRFFALEGGYFDLGQFGFTADTTPTGTLNGNIRLRGENLDALGFIPITGNFSAYGRLGIDYAQARDSFSGSGAILVTDPDPSQRALNAHAGLGLQYNFNDSLSMRAEAERYRVSDAVGNHGDIDLVSLSLLYRFGAKSPAPAAPPPAPEPVVAAAAPAVAPAPPSVVAPVMPSKVSFSADSLFDFDKSIVKPAGKEALDKFAGDLRNTQYDHITVIGHTDRLGKEAYNQRLSTRRAEAVKAYLVESAAIPADKINATGVDGSDPVTKPDDCKGRKETKELKACLQPDRRVDVEVSGTSSTAQN